MCPPDRRRGNPRRGEHLSRDRHVATLLAMTDGATTDGAMTEGAMTEGASYAGRRPHHPFPASLRALRVREPAKRARAGSDHIGGCTPSFPTMTAAAVILPSSFTALTNTVAPFVTSDIVPGLNVTIGAVGGTMIVCWPSL
jgi:hypothetical protein